MVRFRTPLLRATLVLPVLVLTVNACSVDDAKRDRDRDEDAGAAGVPSSGAGGSLPGGGGTSTSGGTTAAGAGGTSAGAASGGSSTSGGSGAGGTGTGDPCTGQFGEPVLLFSGSDTAIPQSFSVTGDDLELFYEEFRIETNAILVRKRATRDAPFGEAVELPAELHAWCPTPATAPSIDVTDDGLRLYLTCVPDSLEGELVQAAPIRMAERADRNSPFSLRPEQFGVAWTSISVSPDELSFLSSDLSDLSAPVTMLSQRSSRDEPFGPPGFAGGIDRSFWHPEFAHDSLHVFGALQPNGAPGVLVSVTRPNVSANFSSPSNAGLPVAAPSSSLSYLTPTLSADCRSIYFLSVGTAGETYRFDVYSARR